MKIAFTGLELPEGKHKYDDSIFTDLVNKFEPAKQSPYYFNFLADNYQEAEAIVITEDNLLDLLILDMEKVETRLARVEENADKLLMEKCQAHLEESQPLCDLVLNEEEHAAIHALGFHSAKPTLVLQDTSTDPDKLCRQVMEKASMMFFYTAGKQEVHAWMVKTGDQAVNCAGKIHSDLARGFIKAEIIHYDKLISAHSFSDARSQGLTQLVDREYPIPQDTVLEIRFKV